MLAWRDWFNCGCAIEVEAPFNCLQHLIFWYCPKLVGVLPRRLDSPIKLEIDSCPYMKESPHIISLPSLQRVAPKRLQCGNLE